MIDVRSCDLPRKMSLLTGKRIGSLILRLNEENFFMQHLSIKCTLLISNSKCREKELTDAIRETVQSETLFELYNILQLIFESNTDRVKHVRITEKTIESDLLNESEFKIQLSSALETIEIRQVLLYFSEKNSIQGLPIENDVVNIVIGLADISDEMIIVENSSSDVIIISD